MIYYLNGTSSSGKSSVALELQQQIETPVFYFSIDTLLYSLSPAILSALKGEVASKTTIEWNSVFAAYFKCLSALLETNNSVIADCPVYTSGLYHFFESSLSSITEKFVVKIECPLEILTEREKARGDRVVGLAARQHPTIHQFLNYDLTVHSDQESPDTIARLILEKSFYLAMNRK